MWSSFMASWISYLVASFLVLCTIHQASSVCPDPKTILPCICTMSDQDIQIWCGQSELGKILDGLKGLSHLNQPIDELILENNLIPSLPGQAFMPLKIVRLMIRDNGLERVSSNWLLGLETSLLELYIVEPELRSLPDDSLLTLPKLEAITLNVGGVKQIPSMAGLARLRYIYIQAPEVTEINSQLFISLPFLEQIHVVSSPKITKIDQGLLSDLPRLSVINITRCGLSWLHPRALARLPSLVELSLIGNRFFNARTIGAAIRDLPVLSTVRLDENEIAQIEEGSFVDIPSLRDLSMTYNRITGIQRGAFYRVPLLRTIDLSHNQVQMIHAESFVPIVGNGVEELKLVDNNIEHSQTLRSIMDALPKLRLLDLSQNKIVDILFGTLRGHPHLEMLHLNDNQIARIGREAFSGMPFLRELTLRNNSLTSHLDFPIWNLPALKGLDLSHNRIRRLDRRVLANLPSLRRIDLSYNTLSFADPGTFLGNPALETINISHNALTSLSHAPFAHLLNLYELDVSYNRLKEFIIGLPQGLEYLRICRNQITTFPRPPAPEMDLGNLKLMDISGNGLHFIAPGTLRSLQKLRWFYVGENALTTLDDQALAGLSSVEALDLHNNRLLNIHPNAFTHLPQLTELSLRGNRLESMEPNIFRSNTRLKRLDLSRNQLAELDPTYLMHNKEMEELYIANNALTQFPEFLSLLPNLRTLDLSHNRLQKVNTNDLANVTGLTQLHLSRNKLRNIKENSFFDLPNLNLLDLESNDLEFMSPHSIRSLPRLQALSLARNKLTSLPSAAFSNLPSLQTVELQENLLSDIASDAFTATPNVLMLNLSNNQLNGMEKAGLTPLRSIELLDLSNNLITHFSSKVMPQMDSLVMLKLDSNRICAVEGSPFSGMSQLRYLSIRDNKMTSFPENTFGRLRTNIASLDIEGNPLRCSCGVLWLQAWLRESSQEGPRCADGSLLRDFRLERQECQEDKADPISNCPAAKAPPGSSQQMSAVNEVNATSVSTQRPHILKPLPEDTDYFDEGFVDVPYHKVPISANPVHANVNHTPLPLEEFTTARPLLPASSDVPPEVLSHYIPGDTPTLYAGKRPNHNSSSKPTSSTKPNSNNNNSNNNSNSGGGAFSFFGVPIPPLNLGNFWSSTRNNRGRFSDGRKTKRPISGPITGPTYEPTHGPPSGPIHRPPNGPPEGHINSPLSRPINGPTNGPGPSPPEIQEGGFIPMLPGTRNGFKPIPPPISSNTTTSHKIKTYEKATINHTAWEIPKQTFDHLPSVTEYTPRPSFFNQPSNNSHKQNDVQVSHVTYNVTHEVVKPRRPVDQEIESDSSKRNNDNLIDLVVAQSTPGSLLSTQPSIHLNTPPPGQLPTNHQKVNPTSSTIEMLTNIWNTFMNERSTSSPSSLTGFLIPGGQLPPFDEKINSSKIPFLQPTGRPTIQKVTLTPPLRSGPSPQAEDLHSHPRLAKSPAFEGPKSSQSPSTTKSLPNPPTTSFTRPSAKPQTESPRHPDHMNWYYSNYNNSNLDPYVGPNVMKSHASHCRFFIEVRIVFLLVASYTAYFFS